MNAPRAIDVHRHAIPAGFIEAVKGDGAGYGYTIGSAAELPDVSEADKALVLGGNAPRLIGQA